MEGLGRGPIMYDGSRFFFWFSSQGIIILVGMMGFFQDTYVLIALIVSSDLVESVSRYPWQDNESSWRQRVGGGGQKVRHDWTAN